MHLLADVATMLLRAVVAACVIVTLLSLSTARPWWIRIWDFPRQQIVGLGLLAGLGMLALTGPPTRGDAVLLAALAAALGYQLARIMPYTRLWPVQGLAAPGAPGPRSLRLVTVNVLMTNRSVDGLAEALRRADPDLVLALETDAWWTERLVALLPEHRHRLLHPLDNTYGIALLSRLELVAPELRCLLKPDIPSIRTRVRLASGEEVVVLGVHPEPPSPTESDSSLPRDAELVLVVREIARDPKPVIVAGDLNDVAWSRTSRLFQRLSGTVDPRIGRGFLNSFDATRRWLRWPLDHVFYTPDFLVRELRRLPAFGSDHFPILIELEYHPRAAARQEVEEADHADHREARATLAEAATLADGG